MTQAIFPKSVVSWTDRIDQVSVVWANDPNSLAAEIIAIENTLGAQPQVEPSPFTGNPVTYSTVGARITDAMSGNLNPYVSITNSSFFVFNQQGPGTRFGHFNSFQKIYDPYGFYNGTDITVQATGLYLITGSQSWGWHDSGYLWHSLFIDGLWSCGHRWDWDFAGFGPGFYEDDRPATTAFTWMGPIAAGKRVQVVSENGTSFNPYPVSNSYLRMYCLRKLPTGALG
jgi:hypothetical protein